MGEFDYFCRVRTIAQHIEYLLLHHDCVVVPGLGSFMIDENSACYDSARGEFLPPVRRLCFNPEVRHNDAMLVSSISRGDGVSSEKARRILETGISALNHQLSLYGEAPLDGLGLLVKQETSEYPAFEPYDDSLPMRRYSGLLPVSIMPLADDEVPANPDEVVSSPRQHAVIPLPLKIVASVAVILVALGILYSTTSLVKDPMLNYASLDTGLSFDYRKIQMDSADLESVSREIILNIAKPAEASSESMSHGKTAMDKSTKSTVASNHYFLVVASYPTKEGAERHIRYFDDDGLKIVEYKGNYRVYAAEAPSMEMAYSLVGEVSKSYPDVWVARQ